MAICVPDILWPSNFEVHVKKIFAESIIEMLF